MVVSWLEIQFKLVQTKVGDGWSHRTEGPQGPFQGHLALSASLSVSPLLSPLCWLHTEYWHPCVSSNMAALALCSHPSSLATLQGKGLLFSNVCVLIQERACVTNPPWAHSILVARWLWGSGTAIPQDPISTQQMRPWRLRLSVVAC